MRVRRDLYMLDAYQSWKIQGGYAQSQIRQKQSIWDSGCTIVAGMRGAELTCFQAPVLAQVVAIVIIRPALNIRRREEIEASMKGKLDPWHEDW